MSKFEHPFGNFLNGYGQIIVRDPNGITPPSTIIQEDDPFELLVTWKICGDFAPYLGGTWKIEAFAESIGPGEECQIGTTRSIPLASVPPIGKQREFETVIQVKEGELGAGAYRIIVLITYNNLGHPLEIAGCLEGPIIQLYETAVCPP